MILIDESAQVFVKARVYVKALLTYVRYAI
jgi:hypothetical protein